MKLLEAAPLTLHASAILGGWALLTAAVAARAWPVSVWLGSGGLLCLSLAGWGHLRFVFGRGLYNLAKRPKQ